MEILVVDNGYSVAHVVDEYESFIWTEKYDEYGEFEIVAEPSGKTCELLQVDRVIRIWGSALGMMVEERVVTEDSEGVRKLKITGRTLDKAFFSNRAVGPLNGQEWTVEHPPGKIIADVVSAVCINGTRVSQRDIISDLWSSNVTTQAQTAVMETVTPGDLYSYIHGLAKEHDLGFRLEVRYSDPNLGFVVYNGRDRPHTIFRHSLDHLTEEELVESRKGYYNTAYIWGKDGELVEIVSVGNRNPASHERRVLYVDGSDVDLELHTREKARRLLRQLGWRALAKHKYVKTVDGRITHNTPYAYGITKEYYLGDIVRWEDSTGEIHRMRVSEYTWMNDQEGPREYPTFRSVES